MAFRRGWFESFLNRTGVIWLAVGVAAAAAWYAWALIPHPSLALSARGFAIAYPIWEELVCFGMCIGLLVVFRQAADAQGRFGKLLAVTVVGVPIVFFWSWLFRNFRAVRAVL